MSITVRRGLDNEIRSTVQVAATPPQIHQQPPQPRWTLKRLVGWVKTHFGITCCRETVRKVLKTERFSWKKARKLLNKASPSKRAAFLETLQPLLDEARAQRRLLVFTGV